MRAFIELVKTTVLGGLLVILPLWITVLLLAKAIGGLFALVAPITAELPETMHLRRIVALLIVVAVCFVAGLVVRTRPGRRVKETVERYFLDRLPGYRLVRALAGRVTGQDEGSTFASALVEIEEALVPAFVVEEHPDGRYTVFVPSVPTPAAGAIYILDGARVHLIDVPFTTAVSVISRWGEGSRQLLAAMPTQARAPTLQR